MAQSRGTNVSARELLVIVSIVQLQWQMSSRAQQLEIYVDPGYEGRGWGAARAGLIPHSRWHSLDRRQSDRPPN